MNIKLKEKGGVYRIVCWGTNRSYIGSSEDLMERKRQHETMLIRGDHQVKEMQEDYVKFGDRSFSFEVLEHCKSEELVEHEMKWQVEYKNTYNLSTGNSGRYKCKRLKLECKAVKGDMHVSGSSKLVFWMRSPDGISWVFPSVYSAAKRIGIGKERVRTVVKGRSRVCAGWTMI